MALDLSIGGPEPFRAIAKSAYNIAALRLERIVICSKAFARIREFIISGQHEAVNLVNHEYRPEFPSTFAGKDGWSSLSHSIIVVCSRVYRNVVVFLELFGQVRFSVLLSDAWDGDDVFCGYVSDPVERKSRLLDSCQATALPTSLLLEHKPDLPMVRERITRLMQDAFKAMTKVGTAGIWEKCLAKVGLQSGDSATELQRDQLIQAMSEELTILALREDTSQPLDPDTFA